MFNKKTVRDIDLKGKTVLVRADYNVPIEKGHITDDYRIKQSLDTIHYLLGQDCKIIICSHLGRPEGKPNPELSLFPVAKKLKDILDKDVEFVPDCIGDQASKAAANLKPGHILLLENLRFHPEEEANDDNFAATLASLAEIFVQDAFGVVHRAHASTEAITKHLPSVAGLLLEREVDTITRAIREPKRPLMAIIGGAKIADKLDILKRFIEIADIVAIGGAMANTFLAAENYYIGESLYDKQDLELAKSILNSAKGESHKRPFVLTLPFDAVVTKAVDPKLPTRIVDWSAHAIADIENYPKRPPKESAHVHQDEMILDIGPFSGAFIAGSVQLANTVIWNGTMGVTETAGLQGAIGPYSHGTDLIIQALTGDMGHKPYTVVGGGDTVGYVESRKLVPMFDLVSTGGGASLELMSGHTLPGVEALLNQ
ncbi:MAG TPA: phosphoglycerate kinase [Candidatus Saccharimonadales bacterium]|jgi:3-phosphoglycerate kinase